MSRKLVAYFSATGTTRRAAEGLAAALDAELYEILPETPYTAADLDWRNQNSRSSIEMRDRSSRPALADSNVDIGDFDVIFVGFPIWWYVAPTIINAFLESHDFSGKRIVLFATSGGSGFGDTLAGLKDSVAADATLVEGRMLNGEIDAEELRRWGNSVL